MKIKQIPELSKIKSLTQKHYKPIGAIFIFAFLGLSLPLSSASSTCSKTTFYAHRGLNNSTHTENTLRAFESAISKGASAIEGDMQVTADGAWVFMHDDTIDRTTDKTGRVSERNLKFIKKAKTADGRAAGVPTVDEFVERFVGRSSLKFHLEVKTHVFSDKNLTELLKKLERIKSRTYLSSFSQVTLDKIEKKSSTWNTSLLAQQIVPVEQLKGRFDGVSMRSTLLTPSIVRTYKNAGLKVDTWTVNTYEEADKLVAMKVDGIITDKFKKVTAVCNK